MSAAIRQSEAGGVPRQPHGAGALSTYLDSSTSLFRAFGAYGLPLSVLIDAKGKRDRPRRRPGGLVRAGVDRLLETAGTT